MKITLFYLLSEKGKKDSLRKGGNGRVLQKIKVDFKKELLDISRVTEDGEVYCTIGFKSDINMIRNCLNGEMSIYKLLANIKGCIIDLKLIGTDFNKVNISYKSEPRIVNIEKIIKFDEVQTAESLLKWEIQNINKYLNKYSELEEKLNILLEKYNKLKEKNKKRKLNF